MTEKEFWERVDVREDDECWEWTKSKLSDGYGQARWKGHGARAHRLAWELSYGLIPSGLLVCHKCDNPPCCNPTHLFLGTHSDNAKDALRKGRILGEEQRHKLYEASSKANASRIWSEESRCKVSASLKGKHPSEATRRKMSAASIGNKNSLGHHPSEETRLKIGEALKGYHHSEEAKRKMGEARKRWWAVRKAVAQGGLIVAND